MRRATLLACFCAAFALCQSADPPPNSPGKEADVRLPNGKLQRDEILKSEHEKSLRDAAGLIKLSEDLKEELEKSSPFVVSVQAIKKTEDIERIAKRIRGRLKRS